MPVPSSAFTAVPYLFGPADATFNIALNTDLQLLAQLQNLQPVPPSRPTAASYTLQISDYQRTIISSNAASTLTVNFASTLSSGFMFFAFRFNNNVTVTVPTGTIISPAGNASTKTLSTQAQVIAYQWDGTNAFTMWSNVSPVP